MKKTMFVTAMLITVLVTMLAANFAFAAAPVTVAKGDPLTPPDSMRYDKALAPTYYAPAFMLATSHRGNFSLEDKADRFDVGIK